MGNVLRRVRLSLAAMGVLLALVAAGCAAEDKAPLEDLGLSAGPTTTAEFIAPTTVATAAPLPAPTTTQPVVIAAPRQAAVLPPPPPPPPAGNSCSPEYEGACVPANVSDVDCAGGSGNGPYYVQEKRFRSVGSDPYGLDSDNDGIACES